MTTNDQIKPRRGYAQWRRITREDLEQIRIETETEIAEMEKNENDQIKAALQRPAGESKMTKEEYIETGLAWVKYFSCDGRLAAAEGLGLKALAADYENLKAQLASIKTEVGYYYDDVYPERTVLRRICTIVEGRQKILKHPE